MRKSIVVVLLGLVVAQLRAEPELKGQPAELTAYLAGVPKIVSIVGESELKIPADRALIYLKVVTENKSLQEALRLNQEVRARILGSLKESGVPEDRVKPSKFSSTPKYGLFGEKAKSYRVENMVKVSAQDEKEFQAVAKLVDGISEARYDSIEFEHSNKDALKAKALVQAIDKATEKKQLYEEKLNVKLTPKGFAEGVHVILPQAGRAYGPKRLSYVDRTAKAPLSNVTLDEVTDGETPTSFGELIYRGQVAVDYAVQSK